MLENRVSRAAGSYISGHHGRIYRVKRYNRDNQEKPLFFSGIVVLSQNIYTAFI